MIDDLARLNGLIKNTRFKLFYRLGPISIEIKEVASEGKELVTLYCVVEGSEHIPFKVYVPLLSFFKLSIHPLQ